MMDRVLLVDDDAAVREALGQTLELADLAPELAGSFIVAKDHITRDFEGVIVTDIRMPGRDGFHLLDYVRKLDHELPVILLTGEGDIPMAVKGISGGAFDFLEKPCEPQQLVDVVRRGLEQRKAALTARRQHIKAEAGDAAARLLFGVSEQSEKLRNRVRHAARLKGAVLVKGEPGTGAAKVAEVLHLLSPRVAEGFVKRSASGLSVPALEEALLAAEKGDLYLDEISALPMATQFRLLEHIETGGGARIIVGSYAPLKKEVEQGRFNPDLRLRLDAVAVAIPPLRRRPEDIPVLFRHYLAIACEQANLTEPEIPSDLMSRLMADRWEGNARALMNTAMRFAMGMPVLEDTADLSLAERMTRVERSLIVEALKASQGKATETARVLQLPRKTFYDKLTRHGIKPEDFRPT